MSTASYKLDDLFSVKRLIEHEKNKDGRPIASLSSFLLDYQKIIYSSAFRRMLDKTQVFPLEEYDYVRTRLTHSIEVECISEEIVSKVCMHIKELKNKKDDAKLIIRCASLIHDIGNPPFGHYGEEVIRNYFKNSIDHHAISKHVAEKLKLPSCNLRDALGEKITDFTKFDGNAQGFRVVTNLQRNDSFESGLNLTSGVLGSIIKYPCSSMNAVGEKFGYFQSEKKFVDFLLDDGSLIENVENPFAVLLECADDIAYIVSDLDDAVNKNVINYEIFQNELKQKLEREEDEYLSEFSSMFCKFYEKNKTLKNGFEISMKALVNYLKNRLIFACVAKAIEKETLININKSIFDDVKENGFRYETREGAQAFSGPMKNLISFVKYIIKKYLYTDRNIVLLELEGENVLNFLITEFIDCILKLDLDDLNSPNNSLHDLKLYSLISESIKKSYYDSKKENKSDDIYYRIRMVIDFISGMTDNYSKRLYSYLKGIK